MDGEHTPSTRPAAINAILRDWLIAQGLIPYQEVPLSEGDPDAEPSPRLGPLALLERFPPQRGQKPRGLVLAPTVSGQPLGNEP